MKPYIIWFAIMLGVLFAFIFNGVPGKYYAYWLWIFYGVLFILVGYKYFKK